MGDFKLPDPKKSTGRFLGLGLLGAGGLAVWYYLVPFLAAMAWNTVSLIVALAVGGVLLTILLSKTFWRRLNIILQALGNLLFGWIIEMNPFNILELQLQQSEKDREELFKQMGKLRAQEASLNEQLEKEEDALRFASEKMKLCQERRAKNPLDEEAGYLLEQATNEYTNSQDFIQKVGPVRNDISRLVTFADKAHIKSGYALENARNSLRKQRAMYDAVSTGQSAMTKALRAFSGDSEMNNAADIALRKLKVDIADKIGTIKNCIAETSKVMNTQDLNDAAKVSMAVKNVQQLDVDKLDVITFDAGQIQTPSTNNKWLDTLKH